MTNILDDFLQKASNDVGEKNFNIKQMNHIDKFIQDNNIKEGTFAVPMKMIYDLYCDQERPPIRSRTFTRYFTKFFKRKKARLSVFYFSLDPKPFKIPQGWTLWKHLNASRFKYKKSKYNNIKLTPEGWLIYLDLPTGRHLFTFCPAEVRAAKLADKVANFYFGPTYNKFNFKPRKGYQEDSELLSILRQGKSASNDPQKKETV